MITRRATLPTVVTMAGDETFHSWLTRLAHHIDVEPLTALHAIGGADSREVSRANLGGYGIVLAPDRAAEIARTTRIEPAALAASTMDTFDGGALDLSGFDPGHRRAMRTLSLSQWLHTGTSSACPGCLADDGPVWKTTWRLPWAAICTRHRLFHSTTCPQCGLAHPAAWHLPGYYGPAASFRVDPSSCANPRPDRETKKIHLCGHPYDTITTPTCTHPGLLDAQRTLDELLTEPHRHHHRPLWLDVRALTTAWLRRATLNTVTQLLTDLPRTCLDALQAHIAPRDDVQHRRAEAKAKGINPRTLPRGKYYRSSTPANPPLLAPLAALALAAALPLHPDVEAAADANLPPGPDVLAALHRLARDDGTLLDRSLRNSPISAALKQAVADPHFNILVRSTRAREATGGIELAPENIPHLWPRQYFAAVAAAFAVARITPDRGRLFCSLLALRLLKGASMAQAGTALGRDPDHASTTFTGVQRELNRAGASASVSASVAQALKAMAAEPSRIDYRALTAAVDRPGVTVSDWRSIAESVDLRDPRAGAARLRNVAIWQWHEVAGNLLSDWPHYEASPKGARNIYWQFTQDDLPIIEGALRAHSQPLIDQATITG